MQLAFRNLLQNRTRLALSVVGVALAIVLILILGGFLAGVYSQATAYLVNTPGQVVVAQADVVNFFAVVSLLPPDTRQAVEQTDGVGQVIPIVSQVVIFERHGLKRPRS
jgi:putative ABC transport system permease protein